MTTPRNFASARQYVAGLVDAGTPAGWRESVVPVDLFGEVEGEGLRHMSYAVGIVGEARLIDQRDRQSPAALNFTTPISVKWSYQLGAQNGVTDYDAALAAESMILNAIMAGRRGDSIRVRFVVTRRAVDLDGWCIGEQLYQVDHVHTSA